jgi:hypothetical protein
MAYKSQVKKWPIRLINGSNGAARGADILDGKLPAIVKYKGKKWNVSELVQFLAAEVTRLKRNRCKPSTKCLFKGQQYLDNKYSGDLDDILSSRTRK